MNRTLVILAIFFCMALLTAKAATGRVVKVLPHFMDTNELHTLSPSLYERDAYQAFLREHPENRSGIRFDVQWKAKSPVYGKLLLRVELRGIAQGDLPRQLVLEKPVEPTGWLGHWTGFIIRGQEYRDFGEVTAWRVTLWEDQELLGEKKSFLW